MPEPGPAVDGPAPDLDAAETAAAAMLDALRVDRSTPATLGTPGRLVRAYAELLTPTPFHATTFPNDEGYDELVLVRDIQFASLCEHHLMPFVGSAVVAYLPGERILGLSKLARIVEHYAHRPQVQERMTSQIAHWLADSLAPKGVGVLLRAEHTCMTVRGVGARGAQTVTSTLLGRLRNDPRSRSEFMALAADR